MYRIADLGRIAVLIFCGVTVLAAGKVVAQTPSPVPDDPFDVRISKPDVGQVDLEEAPPGTKTLLTTLLLNQLPENYQDTKKWGKTRKRWDGLHIKMDGLQIKTKRRWKEVKHGTWKRYEISLVDPEQHLEARVLNMRRLEKGKFRMDVVMSAKLNVYGRLQEWNNGIRLMSISSEAIADVTLTLGLQVATSLDPKKFPPDVIVRPQADAASLELTHFRLKRVSHADGPIVRELGDVLEHIVEDKLAERNKKLLEKVNRQIDKHEDDFRLSLHDVIKYKWLGIEPQGEPDQDAEADSQPVARDG